MKSHDVDPLNHSSCLSPLRGPFPVTLQTGRAPVLPRLPHTGWDWAFPSPIQQKDQQLHGRPVSIPFPSLSWCSWFQLKTQSRSNIFLRKSFVGKFLHEEPSPILCFQFGGKRLCQLTSRFSLPWDTKDSLKSFLGMPAWLSVSPKGLSHVY